MMVYLYLPLHIDYYCMCVYSNSYSFRSCRIQNNRRLQ